MRGYLMANMSVPSPLDNKNKVIALSELKICRKRNSSASIFLPLASHLANDSMMSGVPEN